MSRINGLELAVAENATEIERFVGFQSTLSRQKNTLKKYRARLRCFGQFLEKPWREATRDDIARALLLMQENQYKQNTLRDTRIIIKIFYAWLFESPKHEYPSCVSWIEAGKDEAKNVDPKSIIDASDLMRIIDSTPHNRNKAMLAVLWATGVRASELLAMRIKDVETIRGITGINVNGTKNKNAIRWVSVSDETSVSLLQAWLSSHPLANNSNAFLWVNPNGKKISTRHLADVLLESHKRAGVIKPANPHHYRHSWATLNARKNWPYETFCRMGGWALNSPIPKRYLHNGKNEDAEAVAQNLTTEREKEAVLMSEVTKLLTEFMSNPEMQRHWNNFLMNKEQAGLIRNMAQGFAPHCDAPADTSSTAQIPDKTSPAVKPKPKTNRKKPEL